MTVNIDKQWFVDRWTEKGLTLRKVAKLAGVDPSALSRTLNGEREMKVLEIGKLASILDVPRSEVLAHVEGGRKRALPEGDVAARISEHPGFGFMKGLLTVEEGYDLTQPSQEDWENGYLGLEHRD